MRVPRDIDLARATVRLAKQRLDAALTEYGDAVSRYHFLVEQGLSEKNEKVLLDGSRRLPKGQIQGVVRLAFSNGGLAASRFKEIADRLELLCGHKISDATVRQTLYRMERLGELERYSGKWSAGQRLTSMP